MSSSPYVKLGSRSLDQWKVTELKEELKRRKLATKGLKEDLVKRLDEAVRIERESVIEYADIDASQSDLPSEKAEPESKVSAKAKDFTVEKADEKSDHGIGNHGGSLGEDNKTDLVQETKIDGLEGEQIAEFAAVETSVIVSETVENLAPSSGSQLQVDGINEDGGFTLRLPHSLDDAILEQKRDTHSTQINNEAMHSTVPMETDESKCLQPDQSVQPLKYQVSEVDPDLGFQVTSDSVSTESVSIIEKNEIKVDVITDNVQLELDVKHEMAQPSPSSAVLDGGLSHSMGVEEPIDKKDFGESNEKKDLGERFEEKDIGEPIEKKDIEEPIEKKDFGELIEKKDFEEPIDEKVPMEATNGSTPEIVVIFNNVDGGDLGSAEKLNLDRSSGDDSMEEDVLESKQMEYKSDIISDDVEKSGMPIVREDDDVDVVGHDKPVESKDPIVNNATVSTLTTVKRKFHDKEAVANNDTVKKQRRWNAESLKGSEPHSANIATPVTPKSLSGPASITTVNEASSPKERNVPPSSKPPSNSLRIDRFLRPFTLKAVQELLGKTGTVTSFWMDQIKTHCYVSYSSVEEALETRNAVYNLQWPPNGGRLLLAEFVDPQEVKTRVEAPLASPLTPSTSAVPAFATTQPHQPNVPPQPSPRQQIQRHQLPPPTLPPPPPPMLSNPPLARERLQLSRDRINLPPPPPLSEKVDPPIVTLDDLFRKTKAIPRIYYLPLSDEQVAAKLKAQGKNIN
ncbi:hypothetical protein ABFS82_12G009700 [Erythranthe guttata]|nr:PREDICTED: apoptotic chromatin condensation inducer in the nucleus [Erythranthe guttata]|eukprot:XP_012853459.1 PREDICTED: apoptotic chromatin condensation inducer in the nucleus [Erythranthe guttata]